MGIKTETFFDERAARRNRIVYLSCGVTVVACAIAFFLISGRGDGKKQAAPPPPTDVAEEKPEASSPSGPGTKYVRERPETPGVEDDGRESLREADRQLEKAMDLLREARDLGPGSAAGTELKHKALQSLLAAKAAYEKWLDEHPEDEDRYTAKMADISRQIYWTRKSMAATDFPDAGGDGDPGKKTDPEPEVQPATPVDVPRPPPPTRPRPLLPPDQLLKRYLAETQRALRQGEPRGIVADGKELLEDERLADQHERIRQIVEGAQNMVAFLDAAGLALESKIGQTIALDLRNGTVTGVLLATGAELRLEVGEGEVTYPVSDLAAELLVNLAGQVEFLSSGYGHRTAGSYLFWRGDRDAGLEQLVRARALGADTAPFNEQVNKALAQSKPLQALAAWLEIEPRLEEKSEALLALISKFRAEHRDSDVFLTHREALFRAAAAAAESQPYEMEKLWSGEAKLSSRGKVRLTYEFDDAAEIEDFGQRGKWRIEGGSLVGEGDSIWLERFDLEEAELTFVMPAATPVVVGFWGRDRAGRGAVNLRVVPEGGELKVDLRHGDRPIGAESVRTPEGRLEFTIQRRDEKYQVRLNRKVLFKGTDLLRRESDGLNSVGIQARGGRVEIESLSLAATVDLDWARAGGGRFSTWIRDWFVTAPFPVQAKGQKLALATKHWPEEGDFDPGLAGEDGKPRWYPFHSPTDHVDFGRLRPNQNATAYLAVRVWSPDRRNAVLELVVDDRAKAWLNGDVVIKEAPLFEPQRVPVKLEPGDNVLLVKVYQESGGWWAATRFLTKDGGPMRGLSYW